MSSDRENDSFDDPSLRSALRKHLGKETAPASLRARVLVALDEADESASAQIEDAAESIANSSPVRSICDGREHSHCAGAWHIHRIADVRILQASDHPVA